LKTRRQFAQVYEHGSKAVGRHLVAFALCRQSSLQASDAATSAPADDAPLVGIVASRKVGGSVQRSRAKRLLRAGFQPLWPRVRPKFWLVLVARHSLVGRDVRSHQVQVEIERLLNQLGVLDELATAKPAERDSKC
jgi:ribonuclease P protein component